MVERKEKELAKRCKFNTMRNSVEKERERECIKGIYEMESERVR
jgi:hypothetical protein